MSPSSDTMPRPAASPDAAPARPRDRRRRRAGAFDFHRFAPALAGFAVLVALAVFQADRSAAPETAFLAVWSLALLLPAAALARSRAREMAIAPVLAVLVIWALPAGPARSTVLGALLVSVFAAANAVAWTGWRRRPAAERTADLVAAALGAQMLLRGEHLLAPNGADLLVLVALSAVAGLALARLEVLRGLGPALVAAATALVLGPGWTLGSTVAVVAVALGAELASTRRSLWLAIVGGAILAVGLVLTTRLTLIAVLAGCVVACDRRELAGAPGDEPRWRAAPGTAVQRLAVLGLSALAAGAAWWAAVRTVGEATALLSWAPTLLPALLWVVVPRPGGTPGADRYASPRRRLFLLAGAAAVAAVAAALGAPGTVALAAPLAALAVLLVDLPARVAWPQWTWSAAVLTVTSLFASYPWLRWSPAEDALGVWGLVAAAGPPGWGAALVVAGAAAILGWTSRWRREMAIGLALVLLIVPITAHEVGRDLTAGLPVVLTADRPSFEIELGRSSSARLALVTHLSNGGSLAPGAPVATVRWMTTGRSHGESWPLRAGIETGEWAVRRPDVAVRTRPGARAAPWNAWVEPARPGEEPFFGQRYRAVFRLPESPPASRIEIERADGLPEELAITVHWIAVAP